LQAAATSGKILLSIVAEAAPMPNTRLTPSAQQNRTTIVVAGGYGAFGARLVERLAHVANAERLRIVVAGRNRALATHAAQQLAKRTPAIAEGCLLDATRTTGNTLRDLNAHIVVNASGPFQTQDYTLARAAIDAGAHYIDLADARDYVCGISELDAAAKAAGVLVVSGASSVPGLSSAVIEAYEDAFEILETIDIAISPGNRFDPGLATTQSVLSSAGRPFTTLIDAKETTVFGWQGLRRIDFPGLGQRWLGYVDVPDLRLLPQRYPDLCTVRFQAGVEVSLFHLGLWGLSGLVRAGLLRTPQRLARPLLAAKRALWFLGSDRGGMVITLTGRDGFGRKRRLIWSLVAENGHGPYVPVLGSVALIKAILDRGPPALGAMPCLGLFSLHEFAQAAEGLDITMARSSQHGQLLASAQSNFP
jgi:hypothetical protein